MTERQAGLLNSSQECDNMRVWELEDGFSRTVSMMSSLMDGAVLLVLGSLEDGPGQAVSMRFVAECKTKIS